jgi:hypothetical protein
LLYEQWRSYPVRGDYSGERVRDPDNTQLVLSCLTPKAHITHRYRPENDKECSETKYQCPPLRSMSTCMVSLVFDRETIKYTYARCSFFKKTQTGDSSRRQVLVPGIRPRNTWWMCTGGGGTIHVDRMQEHAWLPGSPAC